MIFLCTRTTRGPYVYRGMTFCVPRDALLYSAGFVFVPVPREALVCAVG